MPGQHLHRAPVAFTQVRSHRPAQALRRLAGPAASCSLVRLCDSGEATLCLGGSPFQPRLTTKECRQRCRPSGMTDYPEYTSTRPPTCPAKWDHLRFVVVVGQEFPCDSQSAIDDSLRQSWLRRMTLGLRGGDVGYLPAARHAADCKGIGGGDMLPGTMARMFSKDTAARVAAFRREVFEG